MASGRALCLKLQDTHVPLCERMAINAACGGRGQLRPAQSKSHGYSWRGPARSDELQQHVPPVAACAMLGEIDPLPMAEPERAVGDRNMQ
jgi:hypothetical protein